MLIRVAAYCRVSTEKNDQTNSLTSQIKYFTEYIEKQKEWQLYEVYYDEGISGTSTKKRIGFNRMITDAMNGKIDLILTKEISRFSRNIVDTISYTRKLKEKGIGVIFMTDNIDTRNPSDELRLSIMSSIAQEESRKTSERVKWGQKRRMEQGVVFGRDLLGYFVRGGKLIINSDEVDTVKLIFHKFVNEGKGTHVIARELREAGIMPKRVKEWSNTVILRVLRNEKYVGDLCQKKTYTPDYLTHTKKYNRGNEEKIYIKNHHEAIIDRNMWDKAQAELERRSPSKEQKNRHSNRYWCSGKLICGECGQHFVSRRKKLKNGDIYKAWRCYAGALHGSKKIDRLGNQLGCTNNSVNEKILLGAVAFCINYIYRDCISIKNEMIKEIQKVQSLKNIIDTKPLYLQIENINKKKRKIMELLIDGTIHKDDFKKQNKYYDEEINEISEKIIRIKKNQQIENKDRKDIDFYINEIERMMKLTPNEDTIYRYLLNKIIVYNDRILFVYLKAIPFVFKLKYIAKGRGGNYNFELHFINNELKK